MARGKSISVYLIDGIANGKIKAQISNWNGIAYKIPRDLLTECRDFEAFQQSGVYFLFGFKSVYIGQAEVRKTGKGIHQRILDHETDKYSDCWNEVVIFTTKDNSLGRTDISYLENRFYNMAVKAGNYRVQNANEPTIGTVTEEKEAELDEFIDQAELILGALGYHAFEPEYAPISPAQVSSDFRIPPIGENSRGQFTLEGSSVPALPNESLKVGAFVRTAMRNLSQNGYVFSTAALDDMCTSQWATINFHTDKPFMKRYVPGQTDNRGTDGKQVRFWSERFTFGTETVYISKEWYERQRALFVNWYRLLY
jgi:hypothetical protein